MSKSYWLKEQEGNFSNKKEDTFDPKKRYVGIRLQQGVPLLDRDWNELEDIRRYEEVMLRKWYMGNGTPDDGFKISVVEPPANDFRIAAGRCIVDGFEAVNEPEGEGAYLFSMAAILEDDLNKGILSEELKKVFEAKEFSLSDNANVRKRKENEWVIADKEKFIVRKEEEELKIYEVAKYVLYSKQKDIKALESPTTDRVDTVYLDVWIEEVTSAEDDALKNSQDVKVPTCVRHKREWQVRVAEGNAEYDKEGYHHYYDLAEIIWKDGKIIEVEDLRTIKLTLASVRDELEDLRTMKLPLDELGYIRQATVNRWIKGGEIEYERSEKVYKFVIRKMLCIISGQEINFVRAESEEEIKEGENCVVLARANGANIQPEIEFIVTKNNLLEWLNSWAVEKWMPVKVPGYTEPVLKSTFTLPLYFFEIGAEKLKKTDLRHHGVLDTWLAELAGRLDARERRMCKVPLLQQTIFGRAVPVANISVGTNPQDIAFDGTHIWVSNYGGNSVSKIDKLTNEVVATVPVGEGKYPWGIAFDGAHIWVANYGGNSVSKIDILTNEVVATVPVGKNPRGIAFDGTHIWVINYIDNSVSKIDKLTNEVVATVSVGKYPRGIAFDGTYIWVANSGDNSVSKMDRITNVVVASVPVGEKPRSVAFDGTYTWVSNIDDNSVSKIDIHTNVVVATVSVGKYPRGVAFDGTHIWVANLGDNSVSKIDILTNVVVATVPVGINPRGVAFDGIHVWVANSGRDNSVSKILILRDLK